MRTLKATILLFLLACALGSAASEKIFLRALATVRLVAGILEPHSGKLVETRRSIEDPRLW